MLLAARIAAEKEKLQTSYLHGLKQKTENKNWLTFFLSCISWLNWLCIVALETGMYLDLVCVLYVSYVWRVVFQFCSILKTQSSLKSMPSYSTSRNKGNRDESCKVTGTCSVVIWIPCSCPSTQVNLKSADGSGFSAGVTAEQFTQQENLNRKDHQWLLPWAPPPSGVWGLDIFKVSEAERKPQPRVPAPPLFFQWEAGISLLADAFGMG